MYAHVYREARPEVFFKGTARRLRGHRASAIGIRRDSQFTAPEPELALVLGSRRHSIFGYTLANDVSAWDIERENALYLTQSKVYDRCCALGPVIVTADEIADPYTLRDDLHHHARRRGALYRARSTRPSCTASSKRWSNT